MVPELGIADHFPIVGKSTFFRRVGCFSRSKILVEEDPVVSGDPVYP